MRRMSRRLRHLDRTLLTWWDGSSRRLGWMWKMQPRKRVVGFEAVRQVVGGEAVLRE